MNELILDGCAPFPLASYLKALGLLRLVAEQVDPQARGAWDRERFLLSSRLDADGLVHFLLHDYRPTPVLNPWNGGSGFNEGPGDTSARDYVAALEDSHSPRFEAFRRSISAARRARERLGLIEKPDVEQKARLIALCRATFPEEALPWLDTALVLTPEKAEFPPLLGTGGNDGRLDFSVTQMKRLSKLFTTADGTPDKQAEGLLRAALFGLTVSGVPGDGIGQFSPQCAGGANASTGFDGGSQANPWDFVLALEGAMLLTASASRRLQDQESSHLSAPFNVRPVSGGYASAGPEDPDMSRAETWLPLWNRSASLAELRQLFSEGRARVGTHLAGNSLDFARAVAGLGVDRGLTEFQRIGFQERNGQAYLAISLGRFQVARNAQASLVDSLDRDGWLQDLGRSALGNLPASVRRRVHQLHGAVFDLCRVPGRAAIQKVLVTVGALHRSFALLPIKDPWKHPRPCPALDPRWARQADDGSAEFDAAAALAGLAVTNPQGARTAMRWLFDPTQTTSGRARWVPERQDQILRPADDLQQIARTALARLLVLQFMKSADSGDPTTSAAATWRDASPRRVRPETLLAWLNSELDWRRAADLFWGLLLVEPSRQEPGSEPPGEAVASNPPAAFSLLKLCFAGRPIRHGTSEADGVPVPCDPDILLAALAGQGPRAVSRAAQRLRANMLAPLLEEAWLPPLLSRRLASAVLLPLQGRTLELLARQVLRPAAPVNA
jgi:CRISPR-associated protein Csx17